MTDIAISPDIAGPIEAVDFSGRDAISVCKQWLAGHHADLVTRYNSGAAVEDLIADRTAVIDRTIVAAWQHFTGASNKTLDLVAVGGYGRAELLPGSDVDLLILHDSKQAKSIEPMVAGFLTFLWDIGLEIGQSVRTLKECADEAAKDLTVLTTLIEARLLSGSGKLFEQLPQQISKERMWDDQAFFQGKLAEQEQRHHRYFDTAHNLEPNVKGSPGGLRDIQIITWLARRHLGASSLEDLVSAGMLTAGQLRILMSSQSFLWRVRFGLHLLTGRSENRLLFDLQIRLAERLGYEDATYTLAVEQLMQRYYRTVIEVSRLNEMLLQLFEESIIGEDQSPPVPLGRHFQLRNGYIEAVNDHVFERDPSALLEVFLLLEENVEFRGINARTIAQIKQSLWMIDEEFRQNPRHQRLFLDLLRAPKGVSRTLRRMNTYGVLGLYIPAFGRIVGRMQYDLFHAYTVDAHTLFVVENLRRMSLPEFDHEAPDASRVMQQIDKPEIAYLAGLFHDIAKGRGGDHSELGAVDAESFCLEHGMSRYDAHLVSWLVEQHLTLSVTAQKKDLNDPNVIMEFAALVGDRIHLDYLYVLTVADVRGTNPQLWNSWKSSLFWELYQATVRALRRGRSNPLDEDEMILDRQARAEATLTASALDEASWRAVWESFTPEYYLRHKPAEIAWHTRELCAHRDDDQIMVAVNSEVIDSNTLVMVYAPEHIYSFARSTAALDELGLNVVDARLLPLKNGFTLDTFSVLDSEGRQIRDAGHIAEISRLLLQTLRNRETAKVRISRRASRQVRTFSTRVEIDFSRDEDNQRTVMELVAGDRPGLLFEVGAALEKHGIHLHNAKIMTIGERAEDVFFITTPANEPLSDAQCAALREDLVKALTAG